MEIITLPIDDLTPDPDNAKAHPELQIDQIKESIMRFGNCDPIGIWGENNLIVEGHGRWQALQELGYTECECIRLDHLTDEERQAYALVHNQLTLNSGFLPKRLNSALEQIRSIDMRMFGFGMDDWFNSRKRDDNDNDENESEEYQDFLAKFEQPRTTDDCYTPDIVYDALAGWVAEHYRVDRTHFIRPFFPGGDYEHYNYGPEDIVVDNPPFSIMSEILKFYIEHKVRFFLFAPSVTVLHHVQPGLAVLCINANITYENRASVNTSFLTNLEPDDVAACTYNDLYQVIQEAADKYAKGLTKALPKYKYPDNVTTGSQLGYLCKYGQTLTIKRADCAKANMLDAQKEVNKAIFGGGLLLSDKAAAEKAAAEKAAAEKIRDVCLVEWPLSDRERDIISSLGS